MTHLRRLFLLAAVCLILRESGSSRTTTSRSPNSQAPGNQAPSTQMPQPEHMYLASLQQWRTQRAKGLAEPDGWLSLVALEWLQPGDTTIGSAPGNTVRLEHAPARLATFRLAGDAAGRVLLVAPRGGFPSGTTIDNQPVRKTPAAPFSPSDAHPTELRSGGLLLIVIKRGDRLYLRVKDAAAPTRTAFHGLHWFPPDAQYTVTAKWVPAGSAATLTIPNVLGQISHESSPGHAEFTYYGQIVRLFPIVEDPGSLFFIFRDATSRSSTYGAGRFLYARLPSNGVGRTGTIVLDFNKAQNPPCAYTPFATCPLPPEQNRLTVPIPAGEKRYTAE